MSETADLLGLAKPFVFEGQSHTLGECDYEVQALFELWLEEQARAFVRRHQKGMTPQEWRAQQDGLRHDGAARVYAFDGQVAFAALSGVPGTKRMAFMLLNRCNPEIDEAFVDKIKADDAAWSELMSLMWPRVYGPPEKGPAKTATPAPSV